MKRRQVPVVHKDTTSEPLYEVIVARDGQWLETLRDSIKRFDSTNPSQELVWGLICPEDRTTHKCIYWSQDALDAKDPTLPHIAQVTKQEVDEHHWVIDAGQAVSPKAKQLLDYLASCRRAAITRTTHQADVYLVEPELTCARQEGQFTIRMITRYFSVANPCASCRRVHANPYLYAPEMTAEAYAQGCQCNTQQPLQQQETFCPVCQPESGLKYYQTVVPSATTSIFRGFRDAPGQFHDFFLNQRNSPQTQQLAQWVTFQPPMPPQYPAVPRRPRVVRAAPHPRFLGREIPVLHPAQDEKKIPSGATKPCPVCCTANTAAQVIKVFGLVGQDVCSICLDLPRDTCFTACGHVIACQGCAKALFDRK